MFRRNLLLPPSWAETFFLWGPRQTGKSTLLRQTYPDAPPQSSGIDSISIAS